MQTEYLQAYALQWLKERPTLAREQLHSPHFLIQRLIDEANELLEAIDGDNQQDILDEYTDLANFFASLEYVMQGMGITPEAVSDHSRFKYAVRNTVKYDSKGYQNGTPAKEQLRTDANMWFFAQAYLGSAWNQNPEYY